MVASYRLAITTRTWVIDSGESYNYGNNLRDFWKNSVKETNMIIKLEDDHQVQAKKKGIVSLRGVDIEAFFVLEFRISLLSVGQLDSHGYTTTFRSGICSIADAKGQKILGANLEDGLYILSTDGSAHVSEIRMLRTAPHSHTINMWHRRLAHLNHQDLERLLESSGERITDSLDIHPIAVLDIEPIKDLTDVEPVTDPMDVEQIADPDVEPVTDPMDGEQVADLDVELVTDHMDDEPVMDRMDTSPRWETPGLCRTCVQAKQQQHIVRTRAPRSLMPFALVHSDLCGPMKHSIRGAQNYIIYIDDCTRYTEVYFLITKTAEEISAKFQHYQAWVEMQGFHIKRFRSDNGSGEYNNLIFPGLLGEKGITFEPSPCQDPDFRSLCGLDRQRSSSACLLRRLLVRGSALGLCSFSSLAQASTSHCFR